ncbi:hypothetical protein GYMLUDRAFT_243623 [Collybiopsis luxurians FD-317 M1]|uniref:Taste receptor type 2 n=1 Tax=Collybiopsis luxurians FD-317 M1 TaxID=944289 RepID=A0A0D0CQU5_9AGAR|nr:hypothetical protein GYMLUDRAFT_243623 [Collybiopsis luxurians FD-317 M1]
MTPNDEHELLINAQNTAENVIGLIVTSAGFGILLLGTVIAIKFLPLRPWKDARTVQMICCILILVCFIWVFIYNGAFTLYMVRQGFITSTKKPFFDDYSMLLVLNDMIGWPTKITVRIPVAAFDSIEISNLQFTMYQIVIGDFCVVWRAWVLLQDNKIWRWVLIILMVTNILVSIADCIWDVIEAQLVLKAFPTLDWLSNGISIVINFVATGLIAWKARAHYEMMKESSIQRKSHVMKILLLFIESGGVFCAVQVLSLILSLIISYDAVDTLSLPYSEAYYAISSLSFVLYAWYPPGIIMLIHAKKSPVSLVKTSCHSSTLNMYTSATAN